MPILYAASRAPGEYNMASRFYRLVLCNASFCLPSPQNPSCFHVDLDADAAGQASRCLGTA
ncbi:hypothetical protein IG631_18541 [Alternaria alternata]|nr:hypothetical protein IG631_18541 [Alternaria alternata]